MKGTRLETMTWPEAEKVLRESRVVLIPVGARLKEHGPHLPLNSDWLMAERLTDRVLEIFPALATPTIPFGYYPAFVEYPGSVHLELDTFRDTVCDICRSLARHGAERIYILNTGISTNWALEPARLLLAREGIVMEYTDLHELAADTIKEVQQQEEGSHADEIETSMMLTLAPEVVRMDRAERDLHEARPGGGLTRDPDSTRGTYSPTGSWGDPTLATREKGEIVVRAKVEQIVAFLECFARPEFEPAPPRARYLKSRTPGNRLDYWEINARDAGPLVEFYTRIFGWECKATPDGSFYNVKSGEKRGGGIAGGIFTGQGKLPPHRALVVSVDDVDEIVAQVRSADQPILQGPFDLKGVGRLAFFRDPEGHMIGVIQRAEHQGG